MITDEITQAKTRVVASSRMAAKSLATARQYARSAGLKLGQATAKHQSVLALVKAGRLPDAGATAISRNADAQGALTEMARATVAGHLHQFWTQSADLRHKALAAKLQALTLEKAGRASTSALMVAAKNDEAAARVEQKIQDVAGVKVRVNVPEAMSSRRTQDIAKSFNLSADKSQGRYVGAVAMPFASTDQRSSVVSRLPVSFTTSIPSKRDNLGLLGFGDAHQDYLDAGGDEAYWASSQMNPNYNPNADSTSTQVDTSHSDGPSGSDCGFLCSLGKAFGTVAGTASAAVGQAGAQRGDVGLTAAGGLGVGLAKLLGGDVSGAFAAVKKPAAPGSSSAAAVVMAVGGGALVLGAGYLLLRKRRVA